MKTIKRNLLVAVVLMLGTLTNYANVDNLSKKIKVVFENVEKGHALLVKDQAGAVLHRENISKSGELVKFFDFSALKDGSYFIEVEKEYEILLKEIVVKNSIVTLKENSEKVIFRPVVLSKDDKVLISRINFDKSPLDVAIYYNGYLIVEETIYSDDEVLKKAYNLDEALKGDYKVVISNTTTCCIKEFKF